MKTKLFWACFAISLCPPALADVPPPPAPAAPAVPAPLTNPGVNLPTPGSMGSSAPYQTIPGSGEIQPYQTPGYAAPNAGTLQYGPSQYGSSQYGSSPYAAPQYGAQYYNAPQYNDPQHSLPQSGDFGVTDPGLAAQNQYGLSGSMQQFPPASTAPGTFPGMGMPGPMAGDPWAYAQPGLETFPPLGMLPGPVGLHTRYPYYSYRRPWYTPGPASLNVNIIW